MIEINWNGVKFLVVIGVIALLCMKRVRGAIDKRMQGSLTYYSLKNSLKKIGASGEGLMLFTNLKNSYIFMKPEQKLIFEALFKEIPISDINSEYIIALRKALEKFEELELSRLNNTNAEELLKLPSERPEEEL